MLASLLWMHPLDSRAALNGSALVLVNPPYLVEQEMREWLPELQTLLGGRAVGLRGAGYQRTPLSTSLRAPSNTCPSRASTAMLPSPAGNTTP